MTRTKFYVAAPDATPQQVTAGGGFANRDKAQTQADEWNAKRPDCPVIVWDGADFVQKPRPITRAEARKRLAARWEEQAERFPIIRRDLPRKEYIRANIAQVARKGLLQQYA